MTIQPSRAWVRGLIGSAAVVALAVPGVASAQTLRHHDPAHDVQRLSGDKVTDSPDNTITDIVRVVLRHTASEVGASLKLREYRGGTWVYVETVKTAAHTYVVQGTHSGGTTTFTLSHGRTTDTCDGLAHTTDKVTDTLAVTVPTSCLKDPSWVKVGVGFVRQTSGGVLTADDGLRTGGVSERHLTLSSRLTV